MKTTICIAMMVALCATISLSGCASYSGGKVADGTNLEIGMTIPGTEWSINFLSYTGGIKVCGNDRTAITVTNAVVETNSYFGVARTERKTQMAARIEPTEDKAETGETTAPD